jgi:hypothetical protein
MKPTLCQGAILPGTVVFTEFEGAHQMHRIELPGPSNRFVYGR